jgi:hypothetical protein
VAQPWLNMSHRCAVNTDVGYLVSIVEILGSA